MTYDLNGNLRTLKRNGYSGLLNPSDPNSIATLKMDRFWYNYTAGKNRLNYVNDENTQTSAYDDIKNGQNAGNYLYNEIGQITANVQEAQYFSYNVYGQVIGSI